MEFLWAIPYFLGAVAAHALSARVPRGNPIVKFVAVGGLGGLGLAGHLVLWTGVSLTAFAGVLAYAFACELYLFLFTLVASSVSVRLLLLLREGDLSAAQIQALYEPSGMVARRIDRLLAADLVTKEGTAYRVTPRGRRLVRLFLTAKGFFRHPQEELPTHKAA
jgi:hypothetical protein